MCSPRSPATLARTTNSGSQHTGSPCMSRRAELALVALFSLAVAVAIFAGLRNAVGGAGGGAPSAYLAGPDAAEGGHEVLQRLGWPLERRRTPPDDLNPDRQPAGLLVGLDST